MRKQLIAVDNLDDRREIHRLLRRLPPRDKIMFLHWACKQATLGKGGNHPAVSHETIEHAREAVKSDAWDERLTFECEMDLWYLSEQYDFSLDTALGKLVEMAKRA